MPKIPVYSNICNLSHFVDSEVEASADTGRWDSNTGFYPRVYTLSLTLFFLIYAT